MSSVMHGLSGIEEISRPEVEIEAHGLTPAGAGVPTSIVPGMLHTLGGSAAPGRRHIREACALISDIPKRPMLTVVAQHVRVVSHDTESIWIHLRTCGGDLAKL